MAEEYDAFIAIEAILNISQDVEALKILTLLKRISSLFVLHLAGSARSRQVILLTEQVAPFKWVCRRQL